MRNVNKLVICGALVAMTATLGCDRDKDSSDPSLVQEQAQAQAELAREQANERIAAAQDQNELAQEQAEERTELAREQAEERTDQIEGTRDNVAGADGLRGDFREAEQDMRDPNGELAHDRTQVAEVNAAACATVPAEHRDECPLERTSVAALTNIEDGIALRLAPAAGDESALQSRIDCYEARIVNRVATNPNPSDTAADQARAPNDAMATNCIFDGSDVDVDLEEHDGVVTVNITTDDDAKVAPLRRKARALFRQQLTMR